MANEQFPTIRLAAAQAAPVFLDRDRTVEKACEIIREVGRGGADIVGVPEGFLPAHPIWYYHFPATRDESFAFAERLFLNAVEVPQRRHGADGSGQARARLCWSLPADGRLLLPRPSVGAVCRCSPRRRPLRCVGPASRAAGDAGARTEKAPNGLVSEPSSEDLTGISRQRS